MVPDLNKETKKQKMPFTLRPEHQEISGKAGDKVFIVFQYIRGLSVWHHFGYESNNHIFGTPLYTKDKDEIDFLKEIISARNTEQSQNLTYHQEVIIRKHLN